MKFQKSYRIVLVLCCAALPVSQATGGASPICDATIASKALRSGGPVNAGSTKNVTAKALLTKGTGPADQTLDNTTLIIEAFDGVALIDTQISPNLLTLIPGRGGQGDKLTMQINTCVSGFIDFFSTFTGTTSTNGSTCSATFGPLRKACSP